MAAAATNVDDVKTSGSEDKNGNGLCLWQTCKGEQLKILKQCMEAVKDEFFDRAKKMGFDSPDKAYYPTDNGICLLPPRGVIGGSAYYIGLVRLAQPGVLEGYWASIRAAYAVGGIAQPIELNGFIISIFGNLNYVPNDVYKFGNIFGNGYELGGGNDGYPKEWQPCTGDELKLLKGSMDGVKDEFYKISKQYGYDPKNKEYYPTNIGISKSLKQGGENYFIGLVQLSKPSTIGGLYASIRVLQGVSLGIGTIPPSFTYQLKGFVISILPCLQYVHNDVYRFGSGVKPDNNDINLSSTDATGSGSQKKQQLLILPTSQMDYLPTGPIQTTINKMKDKIKQKCGITRDLDTFQVATATANSSLIFIGNPSLWFYYVKIYIGINDITNFSEYIYVKYSVESFGTFGATIYLQSAQTFPF